jgi:erythronate-4-phosphate dehydrogenase
MKIVADENIPLLADYFNHANELVLKPGRAITKTDLLDADMLLVRSITKVNQELLQGTTVKFVGSATTGYDHLDIPWLDQQKISWHIAEGCNAMAVVQYVISVIAALQKMSLLNEKNVRACVIGAGRIGQAVSDKFKLLGMDVVLCDPFRNDVFKIPINEVADFDLISLHLPLTYHDLYPTYHLIEKDFLERQKKNCILLNTGRGAAINFAQLKLYGQHLLWCLDVWENEPFIDHDILETAIIATPHIAGYSLQSKYRGVEMLYRAALSQGIIPPSDSELNHATKVISFQNAEIDWRDAVLGVFNPLAETIKMKNTLLENSNAFDQLRKKFFDRYEFEYVTVRDARVNNDDNQLLAKLGFEYLTSRGT